MKYKVTHTTKYAYSEAVPVCHNLVHLAPRPLAYQQSSNHRLIVHPQPAELNQRQDSFGNPISYFSIDQAHLRLTVTSTSLIDVSPRPPVESAATPAWETVVAELKHPRDEAALEAFPFIYPSGRVNLFEGLRDYAEISFRPNRSILDAAFDLMGRIHADFEYAPRTTTVKTTIEESFQQRQGVCQDFAHFQIGCLRSLGLAARYVSGYLRTEPPEGKPRLVGADASHAWVSVYCGKSGWVDLDPTNNLVVSTDHITIAWGRDYSDVCPIQGVIVGGGEHQMHVSVDVAPLNEAPQVGP